MTTASQKRAAEKRAAEEQAAEEAAAFKAAEAAEADQHAVVEGQADQAAGAGSDVEQDVNGQGDSTEGAEAPNRADTLAKFATGETPEHAPAPAAPEIVDTASALDLGGDRLAVVVFDYYAVRVDGRYRRIPKGTVIKGTAELVERGVAIGGLKELEEG
ncbi:hypothetical protein SEA_ABBA_9 [Arthrobacter phage Abba]|uniref:Uncharacterized protein n=1 Tax=Arthrobacter phage Abba TaxID=2713256 RepID=A0A6G8R303_9CAUD|nr:hypothetical protein HYQ28_gp09 [Arthrobacter phage Abba]QIN94338.1 hypothetical protein SEA_ABBA_9 [Arthrobacter phage Abba]